MLNTRGQTEERRAVNGMARREEDGPGGRRGKEGGLRKADRGRGSTCRQDSQAWTRASYSVTVGRGPILICLCQMLKASCKHEAGVRCLRPWHHVPRFSCACDSAGGGHAKNKTLRNPSLPYLCASLGSPQGSSYTHDPFPAPSPDLSFPPSCLWTFSLYILSIISLRLISTCQS